MKRIAILFVMLMIISGSTRAEENLSLNNLKYNSFVENAPKPQDIIAFRSYLNQNINFVYLGEANNSLDVWLSVKNSGFQILVTTLDGKSIIMGEVYDSEGNNVILDIVKNKLPDVGEAIYILSQKMVAESMEQEVQFLISKNEILSKKKALLEEGKMTSVSDMIWSSLGSSYFIEEGNPNAPIIYVFTDLFCGHCNLLYKDLKPYINKNIIRVRYIPIGILSEESVKAMLGIFSTENYSAAWNDYHENGNAMVTKTPATEEGIAKLQHNLEIFDKWNLKGTPSIFYKNVKEVDVKFLYGQPKNIESFINGIIQ